MDAILINNITLGGRLTKDTQFKDGGSWKKARNTIAHDKLVKKNDKWEKETSFIAITAWGYQADKLNAMPKGAKIIITGRLDIVIWVNNGEEKSAPDITVSSIYEVEKAEQQRQAAPMPAEAPF